MISISIPVIVIISVQSVLSLIHLYRYFFQSRNFKVLRLLILTILFLVYNSINGLDLGLSPEILRRMSNTSGIILVSFFFYFISSRIINLKDLRSNLAMILIGVMISLFLNYVLSKILRIDERVSQVIIHNTLIALYYFFGLIISILGRWMSKKEIRPILYGGFTMVIMLMVSSAMFSIESVEINNLVMNLFFLFALADYFNSDGSRRLEIYSHLNILAPSERIHSNTESIRDYNLTEKELEVALLVLKGMSNKEIAHELVSTQVFTELRELTEAI